MYPAQKKDDLSFLWDELLLQVTSHPLFTDNYGIHDSITIYLKDRYLNTIKDTKQEEN